MSHQPSSTDSKQYNAPHNTVGSVNSPPIEHSFFTSINSSSNSITPSGNSQIISNNMILNFSNAPVPDFSNPFSRQKTPDHSKTPHTQNQKQEGQAELKLGHKKGSNSESLFTNTQSLGQVAGTFVKKSQKIIKKNNHDYIHKKFRSWLKQIMDDEIQEINKIKDNNLRKIKKIELKQMYENNQQELFQIYFPTQFQQDITDDEYQDNIQFPPELLQIYDNREDILSHLQEVYYSVNGPLGPQFEFDPAQFYANNKYDQENYDDYVHIDDQTVIQMPTKKQVKSQKKIQQQQQKVQIRKKNIQKNKPNLQSKSDSSKEFKQFVQKSNIELLKKEQQENRILNQKAKKKIQQIQKNKNVSHFDQILGISKANQKNINQQQNKQQLSLAQKFTQNLKTAQVKNKSMQQQKGKIKNPFQNILAQNKQLIQKAISENNNKFISQKLPNSDKNQYNSYSFKSVSLKNGLVQAKNHSINCPIQLGNKVKNYEIKQQVQSENYQRILPLQIKPYDFKQQQVKNKQQNKGNSKILTNQKNSQKKNPILVSNVLTAKNNIKQPSKKIQVIENNQKTLSQSSLISNSKGINIQSSQTQKMKTCSSNLSTNLIPPNLPANISSSSNNIKRQEQKKGSESRVIVNLGDHMKSFSQNLASSGNVNSGVQFSAGNPLVSNFGVKTFLTPAQNSNIQTNGNNLKSNANINIQMQKPLISNNKQLASSQIGLLSHDKSQSASHMQQGSFGQQIQNNLQFTKQINCQNLNLTHNYQPISDYISQSYQHQAALQVTNQQNSLINQSTFNQKQKNIFQQNERYYEMESKDMYEKVIANTSFQDFTFSCFQEIKNIKTSVQKQNKTCSQHQKRYHKTIAVSNKIKQINMLNPSQEMIKQVLDAIEENQQKLSTTLKQLEEVVQQPLGQHKICQFLEMLKSAKQSFFDKIPQKQVLSEYLNAQKQPSVNIIQVYQSLSLIEGQIIVASQELDIIESNIKDKQTSYISFGKASK